APQRRWSALVQRFIASGNQVTVAAPVPHYPGGRPTPAQRRTHHVGDIERGAHGETVLRTAYLPHRTDIFSRTADHLIAAGHALPGRAWPPMSARPGRSPPRSPTPRTRACCAEPADGPWCSPRGRSIRTSLAGSAAPRRW